MPQLVHFGPETQVVVFDVTRNSVRLGTHADNDLVVKVSGVSRRHARVALETAGWVLEDLDSSTFVFSGGQQIQRLVLEHGTTFTLGDLAQFLWLERADADRVARFVSAPPKDEQDAMPALSNTSSLLRRMREMESLLDVGAAITSSLDPTQVLDIILQKALELTGAERGILMLVEPGQPGADRAAGPGVLVPRVVRGMDGEDVASFSHSFARKVIDRNQTLVSTNVAEDPRFLSQSILAHQITSIMCSPLVAEGSAIGCLYVDRRRSAQAFPPELAGLFTALAHQAALAIRNARMTEELKATNRSLARSLAESELLYEVSRGLNQGADPVALLKTCLARAREFFGVERASVMLVDQASDTLVTRMVEGGPLLLDGVVLPLGQGIAGTVARQGSGLIAARGSAEAGFQSARPRDSDVRQLMCAPLITENHCIGVFNLSNRLSGEEFTARDLQLLTSLAAVAAVAIEKHRVLQERIRQVRLNKQIEDAREVQQLLLPRVVPAVNGFQFAAHYVPAGRVGGDYYDFMILDERRVAVMVADVSGHNVASSIIMAMARNLLRMNARQVDSPAEVLRRTSQTLCEDIRSHSYVTVFLGVLDTEDRTLTYANAGNHPPLVLRGASGQIDELAMGGCPLGMVEGSTYADERVELSEGDLMLIFTDGLVEAKNPQNQLYEVDRFREAIARLGQKPVDDLVVTLHEEVYGFTRGRGLSDDFTLVALAAVPVSHDLFFHFPGRLAEIPRQIQRVLAHATGELGWSETRPLAAALEAAMENAIIHGNRFDSMRKVFVAALRTPAGLAVSVSDEGSGFDAVEAQRAAAAPRPDSRPRGFELIRSACTGLSWNPSGNSITLEFRRA